MEKNLIKPNDGGRNEKKKCFVKEKIYTDRYNKIYTKFKLKYFRIIN